MGGAAASPGESGHLQFAPCVRGSRQFFCHARCRLDIVYKASPDKSNRVSLGCPDCQEDRGCPFVLYGSSEETSGFSQNETDLCHSALTALTSGSSSGARVETFTLADVNLDGTACDLHQSHHT